MSSEENGTERNDLFSSLMNDPEFKEAIEAINSFASPKANRTQKRHSRSSKSDKPFKSRAFVETTEVRRSSRLRKETPRYTENDLIDDRLVKHVEKNRSQYSEEYLKKISERQTNFWKNYWQKKREEKNKLKASERGDGSENNVSQNEHGTAGTVKKPKKSKSTSRRGFSQQYLKRLSERRTQYWNEYWRKRREEKAKLEAASEEISETHNNLDVDENCENPNNNEYADGTNSVDDKNVTLEKLNEKEFLETETKTEITEVATEKKENGDINESLENTVARNLGGNRVVKCYSDQKKIKATTGRKKSLRKNKSVVPGPDDGTPTKIVNNLDVPSVATRRSLRNKVKSLLNIST